MNDIYLQRIRRLLECQLTGLSKSQADELKKQIDAKVKAQKDQEDAAKDKPKSNGKGSGSGA